MLGEIQRNCQGFHRKKPWACPYAEAKLPPPNSPRPGLISLMFELAGNSCHILFFPPNHPPSSKFFASVSHSLMVPFSKNSFWLQVLKGRGKEDGWGVSARPEVWSSYQWFLTEEWTLPRGPRIILFFFFFFFEKKELAAVMRTTPPPSSPIS